MAALTHRGRWTLSDRFASAWHYLPVDVPAGTHSLRVELGYDRSQARLDLGCFGPRGFRGWSGSARRSFVLTPDAATPGYLPGELEPGTWQVVIGIYKLSPDGADYQVTAEVSSTPGRLAPPPPTETPPPLPPGDRPPRRTLPAAAGRCWLAGDLHLHTVHSDGGVTVPELAAFAASRGLDFAAVTDHNTVSHHAELPGVSACYGITLLAGQEVTTEGGHAGALGDIGWVDFRTPPDDWLAHTERHGGLMSVNHPTGGDLSWTLPMRRRPPLAEVWHWSWLDPRWTVPLAWWLAWDPGAVPVGGSDWHRHGDMAAPGSPTTWVECAGDDPAAVLDGLRARRVAVSAGRDGPVLLRSGGELLALDAEGTTLAGPDGPRARVSVGRQAFPDWPGHHRLLDDAGGTLALVG
ncbi:MAG TPA: CehA/McbA family metallohydrolase [Streptosporangiaceae bacterium]|nr:CehA/McbA family metallohydrolase [Streptosporangiaceae bacterium]